MGAFDLSAVARPPAGATVAPLTGDDRDGALQRLAQQRTEAVRDAATAQAVYPDIATAIANAEHKAVAPLSWDPASHLLSRFAFGPDLASRNVVVMNGPQAWWDQQVALAKAAPIYSGNAAVAAQGPWLGKSPAEVRTLLKAEGNEYGWTLMTSLTRVTLGLQAWSNAQLYETVVDFFANHLNVANHSDSVWNTRHTMDRDVIRKHAFGTFTDMLLASAKDPAMLYYLDLASSNKSAINENYGRELLELHTVGIGNYTESDVKNASKILTGRVHTSSQTYMYKQWNHWVGPIKVGDFTHPNSSAVDGEAAGDALVRYLAAHPDTAAQLARKMCVRFVSDSPSQTLIDAVAKAYLNSGTQILPMLETIVRSTEFWASRGAKVRRPAEHLIATVRILGNKVSDMSKALATLHWMASVVNHVPLDWSTPDGYPDEAQSWRSSSGLLNNWQYAVGFAQSWWEGYAPLDVTTLYGKTPATSGEAINLLTKRLTNMTFSVAHQQYLQEFLAEPASRLLEQSNLRWYLSSLVPVILEGPHHALR